MELGRVIVGCNLFGKALSIAEERLLLKINHLLQSYSVDCLQTSSHCPIFVSLSLLNGGLNFNLLDSTGPPRWTIERSRLVHVCYQREN